MKEIEDAIINCKKCPHLRADPKNPFPMPHIVYENSSNKIMIIGRNPGTEDDYSNVSFDMFMKTYKERWWECRVGRYLRDNLSDDFIKRFVFFTNACKCSSPKNAAVTQQEIENCSEYLKKQIDSIKPKLVVNLGADARKATEKYKEKFLLLNLYHPSFFIYHPELREQQGGKLKKMKEIILEGTE